MRKSLEGTVYQPTGETWTRNPANKRLAMLRKCKHCQKEFYADVANVQKGMGEYCSYICTRRANGCEPPQKCICEGCGKEFEDFVSRIKVGKGKFCSQECYGKSLEKEEVEMTCMQCGKKYNVLPYKQKRLDTGYCERNFCSVKCSDEARKTGEIIVCANPDCKKEFYVQQWEKKDNRRFCSIKCASKVICGTDHHLYRIDKIGREGKEFTGVQKRMIFEKYGHRCAVTGLHRDEVKLHIHHIDPICKGGDNRPENGIPVWVEVHKKIHNEDFDISAYIQT